MKPNYNHDNSFKNQNHPNFNKNKKGLFFLLATNSKQLATSKYAINSIQSPTVIATDSTSGNYNHNNYQFQLTNIRNSKEENNNTSRTLSNKKQIQINNNNNWNNNDRSPETPISALCNRDNKYNNFDNLRSNNMMGQQIEESRKNKQNNYDEQKRLSKYCYQYDHQEEQEQFMNKINNNKKNHNELKSNHFDQFIKYQYQKILQSHQSLKTKHQMLQNSVKFMNQKIKLKDDQIKRLKDQGQQKQRLISQLTKKIYANQKIQQNQHKYSSNLQTHRSKQITTFNLKNNNSNNNSISTARYQFINQNQDNKNRHDECCKSNRNKQQIQDLKKQMQKKLKKSQQELNIMKKLFLNQKNDSKNGIKISLDNQEQNSVILKKLLKCQISKLLQNQLQQQKSNKILLQNQKNQLIYINKKLQQKIQQINQQNQKFIKQMENLRQNIQILKKQNQTQLQKFKFHYINKMAERQNQFKVQKAALEVEIMYWRQIRQNNVQNQISCFNVDNNSKIKSCNSSMVFNKMVNNNDYSSSFLSVLNQNKNINNSHRFQIVESINSDRSQKNSSPHIKKLIGSVKTNNNKQNTSIYQTPTISILKQQKSNDSVLRNKELNRKNNSNKKGQSTSPYCSRNTSKQRRAGGIKNYSNNSSCYREQYEQNIGDGYYKIRINKQ